MAKKKNKIYRAGAYKRLSQDDGRGEVSNSIINQTELIKDYGKKHSDIVIVAEYDDDGYSGTNFNRPSFQKMMEDVKRGNIQCIMVKDFSRFARNFLDVGEYLEQIFPFMGVRFISVNDAYDSDNKEGTAGDWDVVFKNFLYDFYSKDLSKR